MLCFQQRISTKAPWSLSVVVIELAEMSKGTGLQTDLTGRINPAGLPASHIPRHLQ